MTKDAVWSKNACTRTDWPGFENLQAFESRPSKIILKLVHTSLNYAFSVPVLSECWFFWWAENGLMVGGTPKVLRNNWLSLTNTQKVRSIDLLSPSSTTKSKFKNWILSNTWEKLNPFCQVFNHKTSLREDLCQCSQRRHLSQKKSMHVKHIDGVLLSF